MSRTLPTTTRRRTRSVAHRVDSSSSTHSFTTDATVPSHDAPAHPSLPNAPSIADHLTPSTTSSKLSDFFSKTLADQFQQHVEHLNQSISHALMPDITQPNITPLMEASISTNNNLKKKKKQAVADVAAPSSTEAQSMLGNSCHQCKNNKTLKDIIFCMNPVTDPRTMR